MTDPEKLEWFLKESGYTPCGDHMPGEWSPPNGDWGLDFPYIDVTREKNIAGFWVRLREHMGHYLDERIAESEAGDSW